MNDGKGFEHRVEGTDIVVQNTSKAPVTNVININPTKDLALIAFDQYNNPISYTHQNLVSQIHQMDNYFGDQITNDEMFLVSAPYSSIFGIQMFMNFPLYKQSTIVILPPINKENFVEHISHFKVTISSLPPTLYSKIDNATSSDVSSLRYLFVTFPLLLSSNCRNNIKKTFDSCTILGCFEEVKKKKKEQKKKKKIFFFKI